MWEKRREFPAGDALLMVAAPLTVVAMKLHAVKQSPSRLHDVVDVIELLRCERGNWSLEEVKSICERYGPSGIFDTLKPHLE